jgi:hypothetical protein
MAPAERAAQLSKVRTLAGMNYGDIASAAARTTEVLAEIDGQPNDGRRRIAWFNK